MLSGSSSLKSKSPPNVAYVCETEEREKKKEKNASTRQTYLSSFHHKKKKKEKKKKRSTYIHAKETDKKSTNWSTQIWNKNSHLEKETNCAWIIVKIDWLIVAFTSEIKPSWPRMKKGWYIRLWVSVGLGSGLGLE